MKILAVDTAEQSSSIAIVEDKVLVCEISHFSRMTHSNTLMDMVEYVVEKRVGITIDDIDGFAVTCGPGSFTGLRIGISVVKALAFATSKPSAGISSLDAIAWQLSCSSIPICVMMDARRDEVYCAIYLFRDGRLCKKSVEMVISPDKAVYIASSISSEISSKLESDDGYLFDNGNYISDYKNRPSINNCLTQNGNLLTNNGSVRNNQCLFVGSGAIVFSSLIKELMGDKALFAPCFHSSVRASVLANIIFEDTSLLSMLPNVITPVYLRRADAEVNYIYPSGSMPLS